MKNLSLAGAEAGFLATLPMTALMEAAFHDLPFSERYPLPPRQITEETARKLGIEAHLSEPQIEALTMACHFGYGAAMGQIYETLCGSSAPRGAATGIAFGLAVWTGSYLGLLPALNILKPATRHPARRNALMILAHVAWGASMGALTRALESDES